MMWNGLEGCFGVPDIIKHALLKKDRGFTKDSKQGKPAFESGKLNCCLPCLSHPDTAHGANPILMIVPYNLQETWLTVARSLKKDKKMVCPTLHFRFVNFISEEVQNLQRS